MDPNYTPFLRKAMPKELPAKKSEAIVFLRNAAEHQESYTEEIYLEGRRGQVVDRQYEDQKSAQLLNALADLGVAEMVIEAWFEDLGSRGCSEGSCQTSTLVTS